jgi:uncharacterized protein (DUF58 family)
MAAETERQRFAFLEPAALQELKNLRFAAKRIVEGSFAGRHRSRLRGSSVEFADYREYAPGDDLRRLDWKVFLRTRRPYVRTFDEETNMSVLLALDTSASMNFGGGDSRGERGAALSKLDYCRYLTAALAYLVVNSRDQAGLALAGTRLDYWCEPGSTRLHLDTLLSALERATVAPSTRLAAALGTLYTLCRSRGLLVLVSDFLDDDLPGLFHHVRLFRHRRFEVILFHVVHPEELTLPEGRAVQFYDLEGPGVLEADPQDVHAGYTEAFAAHRETVRSMAIASGCEYELIDTRTPYPDAIRRYLRMREMIPR